MTFDEFKPQPKTWIYKNVWYAEFCAEDGAVYTDWGKTEEEAIDNLWMYLVDEKGY